MYNFLPLVWTKASELSDFPGVNTPLNLIIIRINSADSIALKLIICSVIFLSDSSKSYNFEGILMENKVNYK